MTATCINLKKRFPEYRITLDPAAVGERELAGNPWYYQIPGEKGTIYPYGEDRLALEMDHHKYTVPALLALDPAIQHTQCGDNEHTFVFPVERFSRVAAIVGSRKKRKVSEETRAKLVNNAKKAREAKKAYSRQ